jgi:hypothetical protein
MIRIALAILMLVAFGTLPASAQGTFVYDQQSAIESTGGGIAVTIQTHQPIGQSFTPGLSSIGFVRLFLIDNTFNSLGATVYVNLRSDSITGPILASTDPVFMPDGFGGYPNFFFALPVAITPGQTYYFQPIVQSGDSWSLVAYNSYYYPGGMGFNAGIAIPNSDLWFREGIIVPEPSSAVLLLIAVAVFLRRRRTKSRT